MSFEWNKTEWFEVLDRNQEWFLNELDEMIIGLKIEHEHEQLNILKLKVKEMFLNWF